MGALGIRMIDGAGNFLPESKRGFPSFFTSFCKMTELTNLFPSSKIFARYYLGHLPNNENNAVDVLSGAFMMIDKMVLDQVGSFDEDYFMYAEDIDLSYRIQKAGYRNFYFADSCIIHFKGESTAKQTAVYFNNFYGTMALFVKKHYPKISGSLYVLLLKILIAVKKMFVVTKQDINPNSLPGKALVITNDEGITEALEKHFSTVIEAGEVSIHEKNTAVIFCEPFISFTVAISMLQQMKNQCAFFVHGTGTKSIVGSANKNQPGIGIEL